MLIARIIRAMHVSTPPGPPGRPHTPATTAPPCPPVTQTRRQTSPRPGDPQPLRYLRASRPQPWRQSAAGTPPLAGWMLGQPEGDPWLVLHGGPGSVAQGGLLAPFHASQHWAWGLQQRGSGAVASAHTGRAGRWHVDALLADMEALRQQLGLAQWSVLGGSWGALVAMAYVQKHPQAVSQVVLRGPFLGRSADVWRLLNTAGQVLRMRVSPDSTTTAHGLPALPRQRLPMAAWLAQTHRVLRNATTAPCHTALVWAWLLAEARLATRGARRALLHASPGNIEPSPASLRHTWGQMQRQTRLRSAQQRMGQQPTPAHTQKVWLQVRVLSRQCCRALQGGWPLWRRWLDSRPTAATPHLTLLQGRFDAVCAPANALYLRGLGTPPTAPHASPPPHAAAPTVSLQWVHSGHLSDEPAMRRALAQAVAKP